ncbi:FAD-binding domain-containing protein [Zopfia rhizophila CBS 207.26]|uniref:FAD-binding domain-containing protein n=1 Tax=Zopfia rhizophila CBS 207.26 TaxID=1314779 RepID=A0A6A6E9D2_9PEZI|nr:FAD-binding domain-containing protein [Zopfia rhizophila CBS 207.26]
MYLRSLWSLPVLMLISSASTSAYQNNSISPNCQNACKLLQAEFGSTALYYYGQDNFTIWDAKQQEAQYACRFEPTGTADVAAALRVLVGAWCNFAVKCGGHSRDPDFSNSVGGVTIGLKRLNKVDVAADGRRARVGGGALTADVYSALDVRNLSFVGGRVGGVGVDNIYEYELVLPNATIVTVSEYQHPELYWALRGAGGGNFGVITSFVVRTYPQGLVYAGQRAWNETYTERALDEVYDLYTSHDNNTDMALWYYYGYVQNNNRFSLAGTLRYFYPIENPRVFESINRIPAVAASQQINSLGNLSGPGHIPAIPPPTRHLFQSTTCFPSREWIRESLRIFREEIEDVKSVEGLNPQLITYPIPSRAIRGMANRGGNPLGLSDIQGPLFVTLLSTAWLRPEDDILVGDFSDRVFARLEDAARRLNVYHPYKYIGYGRLGQDIFSSYGADNHKKLVQIQESVDPLGIFTSDGLCRGGFKLH